MADKEAKFPEGTQLTKPDGSMYIYVQVSEDLEPAQYSEPNANNRLMKMKGLGLRFPPAICVENVPKDWWTFVMVRAPKSKESPVVG